MLVFTTINLYISRNRRIIWSNLYSEFGGKW